MATEPTMTLGLRFRRHVAGWVMDTVPTPPPGELEALEARADAAERGMVAVSRREALADAWYVADELGVAAAKAALDVADTEYDNALADWRALVGVGA